jgi:asparagine synthase (glutamine-hydrolysing)
VCGIVGIYYFDPSRTVQAEEVKTMADRIVHRGPDDEGFFLRRNVGLGMRRLSIINLSGGHQPIFTPDGDKVIVFNGEVYNFLDHRPDLERRGHRFSTRTDTEVVLHLYDEYGLDFLDHANGMFGLAIWDEPAGRLVIARDRIGIKPLYYYRDEERLVFASEIKAILALPSVRAELDSASLEIYLKYGFTPAPYTLFRGISKLPPGHRIRIEGRQVHVEPYWRLSYLPKTATSEADLRDELFELLKDAVRYQLVADVPLGAFLSSGIDSSGIVHLMKDLGVGQINTYTIGFGKGFAAYNEMDAAHRFAEDYGTSHHEILVDPEVAELFPRLITMLDEPVADSSFLVTYLVSRLARETVKVILSGVGGDELFGGYRRYLNVQLSRYARGIPSWVRRNVVGRLLQALPADRNSALFNYVRLARAYVKTADLPLDHQYAAYTSVVSEEARRDILTATGTVEDLHQRYFDECDSPEPLDRLMYFDLKTSLPEQLLMLTDKMAMAVSLEGRVPYLDHRVVEFAARLPADLKLRGFKLRYLQKAVFRDRFPPYVFAQKKRGFGAPIGSWIRNELKELTFDLLIESRLREQGLFHFPAVQQMLDAHFRMREDHTDSLLALIAFQIWHRTYLAPA